MNIHGRINSFSLNLYKLGNSKINTYRINEYKIKGKHVHDSYTKLMLHMNGVNGSTTFTDDSQYSKIVTPTNATINTSQYKFGGASGYFSGSGYLSVPDSADWGFASVNFTIDGGFYFTSANGGSLINRLQSVNPYAGWYLKFDADSKLKLYTNNNTLVITQSDTLSLNTWYHIALVGNSGTITLYVNGVSKGAWTGSLQAYSTVLLIGGNPAPGNIQGYIDELRISKDIARWTTNFTPPTSEYIT